MKNIKKVILSSLALALAGSGCTAGQSTAGNSSTKTKNRISVVLDSDLESMDSSVSIDPTSMYFLDLTETGLTELKKDGTAEPELAKSWNISKDGLTYTFHLADAKWSNGDPITADDFVYSWRRLGDPETASEYSFLLDTIHVVNAEDVIDGKKKPDALGVEAKDDKTFVVHLSVPCQFLLSLMTFPSFFALNEKFIKSKGDQYALTPKDLLYSGPYVMSDWKAGNSYTFKKNKKYFKADSVKNQEFDFHYISDPQSAVLAYENGDADVVNLSGDQVDQYKNDQDFTTQLKGSLYYLLPDYKNSDLKNAELRNAISLGVDRKSLVKDVLKNGAVAAEGMIPQKFATGPDGNDFRKDAGNLVKYDPDEAASEYRKAVKELGHDVTLTLLYTDAEPDSSIAENLQQQLQSNLPGITIKLSNKTMKERIALMNDRKYDLALTYWLGDYNDPETFIDLFITGNNKNRNSYSNSSYDSLVAKAETGADAADAEKRWKDFIKAEKIVIDDHAAIPLYQDGGAKLIRKGITGIRPEIFGTETYRYAHWN